MKKWGGLGGSPNETRTRFFFTRYYIETMGFSEMGFSPTAPRDSAKTKVAKK